MTPAYAFVKKGDLVSILNEDGEVCGFGLFVDTYIPSEHDPMWHQRDVITETYRPSRGYGDPRRWHHEVLLADGSELFDTCYFSLISQSTISHDDLIE